MIESAISGIVVEVFKQTWKAGGYAVNQAKKAYNDTQAVQKAIAASNKYVQKYEDRHGQIKIMPGLMKEPLPLESIYTRVKLLDDHSIRFFASPDDLEQAYREAGKRGFGVGSDERLDGMDIANQKQYLMVLGGPGVGKSTFLRKLGLEALKREGQIQRECVPVFIELKEFKGETLDLKQVIAKEFETCGFPAAAEFTNSMLDQGKLLVLLDGLDEVPTRNFDGVSNHIEDFVDQYDQNGFVASCRIAAYKASFQRFTDITIAEFNDEQIEQFIRRWFNSNLDQREETAQKYWELLKRDENRATKELAQTPLLLTFLCLIYDREQTLPSVRSTLYGNALNILLKEWAAQKRLEQDPIYEGFHPDLEKELLADIAHSSFEQDQLFFSKDDITDRISEFLSDTLDAPKYLDGEKVLTAIEVQQGILVERVSNTYSFSHLTLQEYLTARYIVEDQQVDDLVAEHLTDNRWREVFMLAAALMGKKVDRLLGAIDQQSRTYIAKHPKVCDLIKWADYVIDKSSGNYKPIAKRAMALTIATDTAIIIASASDLGIARARAKVRAGVGAITSDRSIVITTTSDDITVNAIGIARKRAIGIARTSISNSTITRARIGTIINTITSKIDSTNVITNASADAIDRTSRGIYTLIEAQFFTIEKFNQLPARLSQLKQSIPGKNDSNAQWLQLADQLESTWLEALELGKEAITFSEAEAKALQDYLYANELLIRCKESAVRVSRKAWEDLESKLLTLR